MCHLLCVDINLIIAISTCHWDRWQSPQWQRPNFEWISPSAHTPCHPWKSIWAKARTIFCPHRDSKVSEVKRLVRSLLNETGNPLKGSLKEWQQEFYNWNTIFRYTDCEDKMKQRQENWWRLQWWKSDVELKRIKNFVVRQQCCVKKLENGDLESENDWKDPNARSMAVIVKTTWVTNVHMYLYICDDIARKIPSYCWTAASLYMADSMDTPVS